MTDEEIRLKGIEFAKQNKKRIAQELTDPKVFLSEANPISIFMAGSPGAGKTEVSKSLVEILEEGNKRRIIRIDSDEIRDRIPGYTGKNSYLFQGAVSLIVEKMQDLALHRKQSFILDGTLAHYEKARHNIQRSIDHQRLIWIAYVYQKPDVAWRLTKDREIIEGRNIPISAFVRQFFDSRATVKKLKDAFGEHVAVFLVKKDFEKITEEVILKIPNSEKIDEYLPERYTEETLEKIL